MSIGTPDTARIERLSTALASNDEPTQLAALAAVENMDIDDRLADELLRLIRSPEASEEVRGGAAIALGPMLELCDDDLDEAGQLDDFLDVNPMTQAGYERVVAGLREVYHDAAQPTLVRRRALEAAVRSPKRWQVDAVHAGWRSDDPKWRLTAVFAMAYVRQADFSAEIVAAFESGDPSLHREAIFAAGQRDVGELLAEITAIATDPGADRELRCTAVEALGWMAEDEDTAAVLEELCNDADEDVAGYAEVALTLAAIGLGDFADDDDFDF